MINEYPKFAAKEQNHSEDKTTMKLVVFYYTQSGQALRTAESICQSIANDPLGTVVYKPIVPVQHYPFPWSKNEFLNAFPEARLSMPPSGIESIDFTDVEDADMVMIVGQSWFLSASLPIQSFFKDKDVRAYLKGRNVVFVNACRNMWLMTSRWVKQTLLDCESNLVGHIVLQDEVPNLISVITIIRWLMYGKKEPTKIWPAAGIDEKDIANASKFGPIIQQACKTGKTDTLQDRLLEAGAIHYKPSVLFVEKVGHRMFGLWAKFVRKKGEFGDERRTLRLNIFFAYLLTALFLISPFGVVVFYLTYPLRHIPRHKKEDCSVI